MTAPRKPLWLWTSDPAAADPRPGRRGFRHLRAKITIPASAPKPHRPGPGRPAGVPNQHRAPRHDVGKTVTPAHAKTAKQLIKG